MMTHCQSGSTSVERAAPYGLPTGDEHSDDPLTRIHRYQQSLRAELLTVSPSRWQRLGDSALAPLFTGAPVRAITGWFKVLADVGLKRHPLTVGAAVAP